MEKSKFDFLSREQSFDGNGPFKRLLVSTKDRIHIINLSDVVYLTSKSNYTHFVISNGETIISSKTIKVYDDYVMDHPDFMRIHKSYIINRNYAKALHQKQRTLFVTMSNDHVLTVADALKEAFKEFLKY